MPTLPLKTSCEYTGMSYPYGALGGYDPYALMAYAGYGGYGQYGGLGMMPGYGGMGSPYMNYGNTYGGYGSPGYNLSYGKALVTGKRYSSGMRRKELKSMKCIAKMIWKQT